MFCCSSSETKYLENFCLTLNFNAVNIEGIMQINVTYIKEKNLYT